MASPVVAIPPFRPDAPQPTLCCSSTATLAPCFASSRPADRPVKPAPITATSTSGGSGLRRKSPAGSAVSSQYDVSFTVLPFSSEPEQRVELVQGLDADVSVRRARRVVAAVEQ